MRNAWELCSKILWRQGGIKRGQMSLNMSRVDVRELTCEMYCGVMAWLTFPSTWYGTNFRGESNSKHTTKLEANYSVGVNWSTNILNGEGEANNHPTTWPMNDSGKGAQISNLMFQLHCLKMSTIMQRVSNILHKLMSLSMTLQG